MADATVALSLEACWDVFFLIMYLKTNDNNNSSFEALVYLHVSNGREIFLCLFLSAVSSVAQSKFEISECIQNFIIIFVPLNTFFCVYFENNSSDLALLSFLLLGKQESSVNHRGRKRTLNLKQNWNKKPNPKLYERNHEVNNE